jgi:hypothetical protein
MAECYVLLNMCRPGEVASWHLHGLIEAMAPLATEECLSADQIRLHFPKAGMLRDATPSH